MSEKSYVSTEQHQCFVCGTTFDTGALLLDKGLAKSMERNTVTGHGICPVHQKQIDEGYIIMIEAETHRGDIKRLGRTVSLKSHVFTKVFDAPLPPKSIAFAAAGVVDMLERMMKHAEEVPA